MTVEIRRRKNYIFYRIADENEWHILDFLGDLFLRTKKEVAQRIGSIIRKIRELKRKR